MSLSPLVIDSFFFYSLALRESNIRGSMFDSSFVNTILDMVATFCPQVKFAFICAYGD